MYYRTISPKEENIQSSFIIIVPFPGDKFRFIICWSTQTNKNTAFYFRNLGVFYEMMIGKSYFQALTLVLSLKSTEHKWKTKTNPPHHHIIKMPGEVQLLSKRFSKRNTFMVCIRSLHFVIFVYQVICAWRIISRGSA